jgi:hypothetical protein
MLHDHRVLSVLRKTCALVHGHSVLSVLCTLSPAMDADPEAAA